jgi:hypothetical protein
MGGEHWRERASTLSPKLIDRSFLHRHGSRTAAGTSGGDGLMRCACQSSSTLLLPTVTLCSPWRVSSTYPEGAVRRARHHSYWCRCADHRLSYPGFTHLHTHSSNTPTTITRTLASAHHIKSLSLEL